MHKTHRLTDSQYMEVEGLLQAMDMPTSHDPEAELESESTSLCRLSRYNVTNLYDGPAAAGGGSSLASGRQRCYTMPHVPPPAPPSTPTLLTVGGSGGGGGGGSSTSVSVSISPTCSIGSIHPLDGQSQSLSQSPLNHFIYVKNGKNLRRESRCVDSELSKLFNVVSITNRLTAIKNRSGGSISNSNSSGILNASRTISKLNGATATKIFKIHRDPKEFLRETDEDSVSAPEYDEEEEDTRFRFFRRARYSRRMSRSGRKFARKFARFEHHERMETIVDSFDAAMSFNDADT
ncbi:uncharacterized protein LOC108149842 [Drosophila elegans]|uniref:uncharacterized protein LOC108149842 n=1 Tax=Drosophila elegans TaxID=30023 RepID=UPI0007E8A50E|nr:uncharacterized protein LOC108149842 [Drosophila elegans]